MGGKLNQTGGAQTFGLGQLNYLGNKVIKPSAGLKQTNSVAADDNQVSNFGRTDELNWQLTGQNGYHTQNLINVTNQYMNTKQKLNNQQL